MERAQHLHAITGSHNHHHQQLKPTTQGTKLKHNQTIQQPQEDTAAALLHARSNQLEARATRRVAATEKAQSTQCVAEEDLANPTTSRPSKPAAAMVLRRCEDLRIRTSDFQKIEEDSQCRPADLRRQHKLQQHQRA